MKNIQLGDQTLYRKILLRNIFIYYLLLIEGENTSRYVLIKGTLMQI